MAAETLIEQENKEIAKQIVEEYQKKNLYIFCAAGHNGTSVIEQLIEATSFEEASARLTVLTGRELGEAIGARFTSRGSGGWVAVLVLSYFIAVRYLKKLDLL